MSKLKYWVVERKCKNEIWDPVIVGDDNHVLVFSYRCYAVEAMRKAHKDFKDRCNKCRKNGFGVKVWTLKEFRVREVVLGVVEK